MRQKDASLGLLVLFGTASLAAVGLGALICALSDMPAALWGRNLAAWLVGALLAWGVAASPSRILPYLPWAAAAALAATFLGADQGGVHRWIAAGPLTINVAMLALPAAVVGLAAAPSLNRWAWLAALLCLGLLVLQPDASQATAFGGAVAIIAGARADGRKLKTALVLGCLALAAAAWLRPDPLAPVPEVEEIIELAAQRSLLLAGLAVALLAAVAAAPVAAARSSTPEVRLAATALGACLALWALTPAFGAFPVPLVGIGLSPILGAWLGVGVLASAMRRVSSSAA